MFSMCLEAIFRDMSGVGQERDGHMVSWAEMMCMDSSFRMYSEDADLDNTSITYEKFRDRGS
jgi:hypothetical protein